MHLQIWVLAERSEEREASSGDVIVISNISPSLRAGFVNDLSQVPSLTLGGLVLLPYQKKLYLFLQSFRSAKSLPEGGTTEGRSH